VTFALVHGLLSAAGMSRRLLALLLLGPCAGAAGCEDAAGQGPRADARPDAGDARAPADAPAPADATEASAPTDTAPPPDAADGPPASQLPIADRPSRGSHRCRVDRGRTDHAPLNWGSLASALVVAGSPPTAYVARRQSMSMDPQGAQRFVVGPLGADGTLGPATAELPAADNVGNMAAAARGDGFALVWGNQVTTVAWFAAFDGAGKLTAPPRILPGVAGISTYRLAAGPDGGLGLVFEAQTADGGRAVFLTVLDGAGAVRMPPRRLDARGPTKPALRDPTIVAGPAGYAMTWTDTDQITGGTDFARADARGAEVVPARRISVATGPETSFGRWAVFASLRSALVETPDGYLAAWSEQRLPGTPVLGHNTGTGAWTTLVLARLDPSGVRRGPPVPMRASTDSVDETEPMLIRRGDAVAVTWAHGSHIYICSGCVPDERIDLLLVDPADLTPLSEVVSLTKDATIEGGGLVRHETAVLGNRLVTTFRQTFHTWNSPGSGTFTCDP
jgi:hypothetical protein